MRSSDTLATEPFVGGVLIVFFCGIRCRYAIRKTLLLAVLPFIISQLCYDLFVEEVKLLPA